VATRTVACLPGETLTFLRALKRNNRREWFQPRKEQYEAQVRAPMLAIVERLAVDLRDIAPDIVVDPKHALYRIYRDTRFSENKTPYKTHVAASFPSRGLPKHEGAGLYFHVSPDEVWIGGGMYAPQTSQLQAVREHIAANVKRLRAIVESPGFRRHIGALEGERLQRVPHGFPKDHAAAEYLKYRQFLAGRELPSTAACSPKFYATLLTIFRQVAPLARFLNEPLAKS
jgi:uncharacterized protein (TIGR02453 family)